MEPTEDLSSLKQENKARGGIAMICVEPDCHNYSGSVCKMEIFVQKEGKEERENMKRVSVITSQQNTLQNVLSVLSKFAGFNFTGAEPRYYISFMTLLERTIITASG